MSGREWLIRAIGFVLLSWLVAVGPVVHWILASESALAASWRALPWVLAALACTKISAAAWIATRLHHDRMLADRALVSGATLWVIAVLTLYAVLVWLVGTPLLPHYMLGLIAILAVPVARLAAVPLALARNRHR